MSILAGEARETLSRWFSDPDTWAGVFENQQLGHPDQGRRIAFPYSLKDYEKAKLGDRAPDTKAEIGWRYVLIAKCRSYGEVLAALEQDEKVLEDYEVK